LPEMVQLPDGLVARDDVLAHQAEFPDSSTEVARNAISTQKRVEDHVAKKHRAIDWSKSEGPQEPRDEASRKTLAAPSPRATPTQTTEAMTVTNHNWGSLRRRRKPNPMCSRGPGY
jgi:hypothetical protein